MTRLIQHLRSLNSKERFYLIGQALGNPEFRLGAAFRKQLGDTLKLEIPEDSWAAMDYHIDWITAALHLAGRGDRVHKNEDRLVEATQRDVDLLVAFERRSSAHLIMVEAKGLTPWNDDQLRLKAERLRKIFGDDGFKWPRVTPHFLILSRHEPQRLRMDNWPDWMKPQGKVRWMLFDIQDGLMRVTRCTEDGRENKNGRFWTVIPRDH